MKYIIAAIVLGIAGVVLLGASEVHAQRMGQQSAVMKGAVSSLTQQQLLVARRGCESLEGHATSTDAYCTEVQRIMESQSLQVITRPPHFIFYKPS